MAIHVSSQTSVPDTSLSSSQEEKRIVLIGCTGHGKGTFANFLYNLGQQIEGKCPLFQESGNLKPDTQNPYYQRVEIQNSPNATEARKRKRFTIIDTPGLNDIGRDTDLKHMINVLRMICTQFQGIHALVLVYRHGSRADQTMGPTLRYYRDLFAPLFRAQNAILVVTYVSSDTYEVGLEKGTWDNDIKHHLDECNKMLELDTSDWNCPIVDSYFVNSKWSNARIEKLLQKLSARKGSSRRKEFNTIREYVTNKEPEEIDLLWRSYLMREKILDYISGMSEVLLDTHLIPLPPALENERKNALFTINARINELLKTVAIENKRRGDQLEKLTEVCTDITHRKSKMEQCKAEIMKLSGIHKTPAIYVAGDDWIRLSSAGEYTMDAPCNNGSECGGCQCEYAYKAHNASHPGGYPKIMNRTWIVKVNPDFLNIIREEDRHWFYKFWLEYSGESHNRSRIATRQQEIQRLEGEEERLAQKLQKVENALKTAEAELAEHQRNLHKLNNDKDTLLPQQFSISKVEHALKCMEQNMQAKP